MKLPYKWKPREYQKDAYNAWIKQGFKQLDLIWHRRAGKDSVCLHGTMVKMWQRPATYWHMLPQANQVRKAIWKAVNPHTGKRWIDEAFPEALREATNESEMFIKFINGSTWQCLGSDNYMGAIGSNPAGIVYSEWSLTNPAASGYLRPILAENDGWELKIGTPRGENHAYRTHMAGIKDNKVFAQMLTVDDTQMDWDMDYIKSQYIVEFGEDIGTAMFLQEFYCSFKAPVQGSIWGKECTAIDNEGRYTIIDHNPNYPVYTAWDIGRTDATAIWFYQVINDVPRLIDFEECTLKNLDYFASRILGIRIQVDLIADEVIVTRGEKLSNFAHRRAYNYGKHYLPHDARHKTQVAKGKSTQQQMRAVFGLKMVGITPNLSIQDGIKAGRKLLQICQIDRKCEQGFNALKEYKYKYDDTNKVYSIKPLHDWASNPADALRYVAINWRGVPKKAPPKPKPNPNIMDNGIPIAEL